MRQIQTWQQPQWQQLLKARQQDRLAHALLLTGDRGLGQYDFAETLAQAMLCQQNNDQACGICRDCQLMQAGYHPDFFPVKLEEKSKAIKVEQIRELSVALGQTAARGGYQVVIIDPADSMNRAAANALLKTLEEPCGQVLLLLIAHNRRVLPATIASRCQLLRFTADADQLRKQWSQDYVSLRDRIINDLLAMSEADENSLTVSAALAKAPLNLVVPVLLAIVMDLLRLNLGARDFIVNHDQGDALARLSSRLARQDVLDLLQQLTEANRLLHGATAVNTQLLLDSILLRWEQSC